MHDAHCVSERTPSTDKSPTGTIRAVIMVGVISIFACLLIVTTNKE